MSGGLREPLELHGSDDAPGGDAVIDVAEVEGQLGDRAWSFETDEAARIEAHWTRARAARPQLFDGRVLLMERLAIAGGVARGAFVATSYSAFLAWHDGGFPPAGVRNAFAMAAVRCRDGAYLLGVMAAHTANAGRAYFPAGTPDLDDVGPDCRVDLEGSALRELCEETGLGPDELALEGGWTLVLAGPRVAFMRPMALDLPSREAVRLVEARIAAQAEPELAGVVAVDSLAALDRLDAPDFMRAYLERAFAR